MSDRNFIVQNGLTVGPTTIDAASGNVVIPVGKQILIGNVILRDNGDGKLAVRDKTDNSDVVIVATVSAISSTQGNIQIGTNHIESTNTNGLISLRPNGTGIITLSSNTIEMGRGGEVTITTGDTWGFGNNGNLKLSPNGTGIVKIPAPTPSSSYVTGALVVTGGAGVGGNLHLPSTAQLHIGADLVAVPFPNSLVTLDSNVNTYQQVVMQNISNGTSASSDYIAVADTGSDSTNYVDLGINSSLYSDVNYTIGGYLDSYAYSNGGNFLFGTQTPGKGIVFHTGGTLSANLRGRLTDQGLTINTATSTSSISSGALVVNGGVGIAGDVRIGGNLYVGNLISTNTTTLTVTAPLLYLTTDTPYPYNYDIGFYSAFTGGPSNVYAHSGLVRNDSDSSWYLFSNVGEPAGSQISFTNIIYDPLIAGAYTIKGDPVTALQNGGTSGKGNIGSSSAIWNTVYATSLQGTLTTGAQPNVTSVGTLTGLSLPSITHTGTTNIGNIGQSDHVFNTVHATTFSGVSTTAKYADLAEQYTSDAEYAPGTVVIFGGTNEITISTTSHNTAVAGVISTNPAHLMNSELDGLPVALQGRVPCKVLGPIQKGDLVVTSDLQGIGQRLNNLQYLPGCVIGKSLENIESADVNVIEIVVGRI